MTENNNESMVRYLLVSILETAFNLALSYDAEALARLKPFAGQVIRLKTDLEDLTFYCELGEAGVSLFVEHEGPVNARVRLPAGMLARHLLGLARRDTDDADDIKVTGDQAMVLAVYQVLHDFSLITLCKQILGNWLPEFDSFESLLKALRSQEPAWITRFEHLPQLLNETMVMVRHQGEIQALQMQELRIIRMQLESDRRTSQISTLIGFCLIIVAFMAHNGYLQLQPLQMVSFDTAIMLIVAMVLLVPRLLRKKL